MRGMKKDQRMTKITIAHCSEATNPKTLLINFDLIHAIRVNLNGYVSAHEIS